VAEVKKACIARQAYLDRLDDYDKRFGSRTPVPPPSPAKPDDRPAGRRANVLVHKDAPQYLRALEITRTADGADWKHDAASGGIWVAYSLYSSAKGSAANAAAVQR
jgi:hypothetical protein